MVFYALMIDAPEPAEISFRAVLAGTLYPVLLATVAIELVILWVDDLDRQGIATAAGWGLLTRGVLLAYDVPATLVLAFGLAMIFAGLWGVPTQLRRHPGHDRFELTRLVMAGVMVWGVLGTLAGWSWNDTVVAPVNTWGFQATRQALPAPLRVEADAQAVAGLTFGELGAAIQADRERENQARAHGDRPGLEAATAEHANAQAAFQWRLSLPVLAIANALLGLMLGFLVAESRFDCPWRRVGLGLAVALAIALALALALVLPLPAWARPWVAPLAALVASVGLLPFAGRAQKRLQGTN